MIALSERTIKLKVITIDGRWMKTKTFEQLRNAPMDALRGEIWGLVKHRCAWWFVGEFNGKLERSRVCRQLDPGIGLDDPAVKTTAYVDSLEQIFVN